MIPNEKEFRLDFLTTVGRSGDAPYEHPGQGCAMRAQRGLFALGSQFPDEGFGEWLKAT